MKKEISLSKIDERESSSAHLYSLYINPQILRYVFVATCHHENDS